MGWYNRWQVVDPTYVLVNDSDSALPDRQKLAEDLELFRSVPWFREGVTASGVFNNRIHT